MSITRKLNVEITTALFEELKDLNLLRKIDILVEALLSNYIDNIYELEEIADSMYIEQDMYSATVDEVRKL